MVVNLGQDGAAIATRLVISGWRHQFKKFVIGIRIEGLDSSLNEVGRFDLGYVSLTKKSCGRRGSAKRREIGQLPWQ